MAREFRLPDPGEGIHEAEVVEVHVSAGDEVSDGDVLFTVETDKAVTDVPSAFDGRIVEVMAGVGDVVEVGSVLLTYEGPDGSEDREGEVLDEDRRGRGEGEEAPDDETPSADDDRDETPEGGPAPAGSDEREHAPQDEATDRGGPSPDDRPRTPTFVKDRRPVPASPSTRALAASLDVDLHEVEGSGPDGRIGPEDVEAAAGGEAEPAQGAQEPSGAGTDRVSDDERWGPVERVEMRGVRRATARAMAESWRRIPHVHHHDVADITELERLRTEHADETDEGVPLTITAFLLKAAVAALRIHPRFNARYDEDADELVILQSHHIGVAVDTEEGLVVPVIRDVDSKPLVALAAELAETAERMRSGDRDLEDLRGGSFTITNPGGIGGTSFEPIIRHPEVAILGAARARWMPVVGEGGSTDDPEIRTRLHLPLVLGFDHRVNDGADAARFVRTVVETLEDPARLLLRS